MRFWVTGGAEPPGDPVPPEPENPDNPPGGGLMTTWAWRADYGLAYVQGDPVTLWEPIRNNFDLQNLTALQLPVYDDGTLTANGLPAVGFIEALGDADWLSTQLRTLDLQFPATCVLVCEVLTADATIRDMISVLSTTSRLLVDPASFSAPVNALSAIFPALGSSGLTITPGLHLFAVVANGNNSTIRLDGTTVTGIAAGTNSIAGPIRVGAGPTAIDGCRIYAHELWFYDGALSGADLDQWRTYAQFQWLTP